MSFVTCDFVMICLHLTHHRLFISLHVMTYELKGYLSVCLSVCMSVCMCVCVCLGVNSFHAYMSNEGVPMLRDSDLYRWFRHCKQLNALPLIHAENGSLIEEVLTYLLTLSYTVATV